MKKEEKNKQNNKKTNNKINKLRIGGMATFKGVLLKSNTKQVVTSKVNNKVVSEVINIKQKKIINNIPFIRGILGLYSSIKGGIPYIVSSAENIVNNKVIEKDEKITINKFELIISFITSSLIIILLWISLPMILSLFLPVVEFRFIIQILIKLGLFSIYINMIKKISYLNKLFEYHGAEHTSVNYYENNVEEVKNIKSILDINLDKIGTYSRFHRRCGSNYIMYLLLLSLIITIIIPSTDILLKIIIEVVTFPLIIGIAYELLSLSTLIPKKLEFILKPFMYVQNITTKKPSKDKLMLGVASLLEITNKHITIKTFINQYINKYLINKEVNQNDILRLIAYELKIDKNMLYINLNNKLISIADQINIKNILDRYYIKKEPLQYIIGIQSFYNEEYIVNKNVLIPRADSEILVETAIKYIEENKFKTCIDMCSGTGAIGISIANNSSIEKMVLSDISSKAISVAKGNIIKNKVTDKCKCIKSNLFENIIKNINSKGKSNKFDIIVTNPPYIKAEELLKLSDYVKQEPMLALNGGKTGLDIYGKIFKEARYTLNNNGYIILEIGYDQKQDLINIINKYQEYEYIECLKDLAKKDRVIVCRFHQI